MKATTHEVVQEDRSLIMPVFPFPHLQCKTRTEKALKSELSFMTLTVEVILQEGFVPGASRFAVCNCGVSINSNQESFPQLGSDEGEPQGRSFTQPTLPPKGRSTARVNGPTLQPRKQQLFLLPDNHQRPWVRDFLLSWSSAFSPHPGCLCSALIDAQTQDWASPRIHAAYLVAIQFLILKIIFIAQGESSYFFQLLPGLT